jgi:hypothetical protein
MRILQAWDMRSRTGGVESTNDPPFGGVLLKSFPVVTEVDLRPVT